MLLRSQVDALNRLKVFSDCSWHVSKKMLRFVGRHLLSQVFFVSFHGLDNHFLSGTEKSLGAPSGGHIRNGPVSLFPPPHSCPQTKTEKRNCPKLVGPRRDP